MKHDTEQLIDKALENQWGISKSKQHDLILAILLLRTEQDERITQVKFGEKEMTHGWYGAEVESNGY